MHFAAHSCWVLKTVVLSMGALLLFVTQRFGPALLHVHGLTVGVWHVASSKAASECMPKSSYSILPRLPP